MLNKTFERCEKYKVKMYIRNEASGLPSINPFVLVFAIITTGLMVYGWSYGEYITAPTFWAVSMDIYIVIVVSNWLMARSAVDKADAWEAFAQRIQQKKHDLDALTARLVELDPCSPKLKAACLELKAKSRLLVKEYESFESNNR